MRYMKRRRAMGQEAGRGLVSDPMDGVANLFDIGLVFIVGLIVILFSSYPIHDLFDEEFEMTILKKSNNGEMEIVTDAKRKIEALRVSKNMGKGEGHRMGVAYRMDDGSMVYVPDDSVNTP